MIPRDTTRYHQGGGPIGFCRALPFRRDSALLKISCERSLAGGAQRDLDRLGRPRRVSVGQRDRVARCSRAHRRDERVGAVDGPIVGFGETPPPGRPGVAPGPLFVTSTIRAPCVVASLLTRTPSDACDALPVAISWSAMRLA